MSICLSASVCASVSLHICSHVFLESVHYFRLKFCTMQILKQGKSDRIGFPRKNSVCLIMAKRAYSGLRKEFSSDFIKVV